jgi:hypothetical protein
LELGSTIKSPQILELSGIGRSEVLSKIGVDLKIDLPGVGENVQEHNAALVMVELDPKADHETFDRMLDPGYAAESLKLQYVTRSSLYLDLVPFYPCSAQGKGIHHLGWSTYAYFPLSVANPSGASAIVDKAAQAIADLKKSPLPSGLAEQLDLQLAALRDDTVPDMEILMFPGFFPSICETI